MMMMQVTFVVAVLVLAASVQSDPQFYLPIDCDDIHRHENATSSGVYTIYPGGPATPLNVYCDMDTDGGRWTVFQRRMDGTESFFRPWSHYKTGFGIVAGEYWLGETKQMLAWKTSSCCPRGRRMSCGVDMEDWEGGKASAQYSSFSIDNENAGYQLHLGSFTGGAAGDGLTNHNNMKFTTFDKDQDQWDKNCAQHYLGGFWYNNCHMVNPNGMYAPHGTIAFENAQLVWHPWKGWNYSLKKAAMKIRSVCGCSCTY